MEPRIAHTRKLCFMLGYILFVFAEPGERLKFPAKLKQQGQKSHCIKGIS